MSSGFVSGGTADNPAERDEEWKRAAKDLEDARRAKEDLAKQHDGKSLFEVLQANKEKKQADFEERARFKLHNALDEDEADYLGSLQNKKRQEEANVRKETLEQLNLFRRQQEEAERKALEEDAIVAPPQERGQWDAVGRKRKNGPEAGRLKGWKLRKSSSAAADEQGSDRVGVEDKPSQKVSAQTSTTTMKEDCAKSNVAQSVGATKLVAASALVPPANAPLLALGYVSSDDD